MDKGRTFFRETLESAGKKGCILKQSLSLSTVCVIITAEVWDWPENRGWSPKSLRRENASLILGKGTELLLGKIFYVIS